ncbi:MAG: hypothetical protein NTV51_14675 [Verrucomicrobia bacterium]|nr:hypothetical protein [Verrucomicrobiota bacterium]
MFRTTLTNLDLEAAHASPDYGKECLGELAAHEVVVLLDRFCQLDPAENARAEPEIVFESRRSKYVVRTGMGQLHVYDPRRPLEPALVLTALQLLAELDGTAAAARTRPPFPLADDPQPEPTLPFVQPKPVSALRVWHRVTLSAATILLTGYLVYTPRSAASPGPAEAFEPIAHEPEAETTRSAMAGVYMTGSQAGHHGIALAADGTMKLFQLNAQSTPSLIRDTFRVGRIDGKIAVLGHQPGGAMRLTDPTTLTFCGETYRRIP